MAQGWVITGTRAEIEGALIFYYAIYLLNIILHSFKLIILTEERIKD